jgi:phosphoserine phosphatase RsbU/P
VKVLIADDDIVSVRRLEIVLPKWGYEPLAVHDGDQAWGILRSPERPRLALIDWMMPAMSGVEICRALRQAVSSEIRTYVILVTARARPEEVVEGLDAGADDYLTKPYRNDELKARLGAGLRVVTLEQQLAERVAQLEESLSQVRRLQGLLPICAYCKKVRDDKNSWHQIEAYVSQHSEAKFSHGVCPSCMATVVEQELEEMKRGPDPK